MKYGSISRVFLGLMLLFFNINIFHLNLITTFLGAVLIATAAWQLAGESRYFRNAFILSIIQLGIQVLNFILTCSKKSGSLNVVIALVVIGTADMIALLSNLCSGLSEIAHKQGNIELGRKLSRCSGLYFTTAVMMLFTVFMPQMVYIVILPTIIIFIYILVQVNRLEKVANNSSNVIKEKRLDGQFYLMLASCMGLTVLICSAMLIYSNCPDLNAEVYNPNDSNKTADIQGIKSKMLTLGFDKEIVNDLPDSEVANYQNVNSVHSSTNLRSMDEGTLLISECVSTFENGKQRFLVYYKWNEIPDHQFCDKITVDLDADLISIPDDFNFIGFGLYDRKTENGVTTFKTGFVQDESDGSGVTPSNLAVEYRVFGANKTNQRGFFAFNARLVNPRTAFSYNTVVNYSHQKTIFNLNNTFEINTNQQQSAFGEPNNPVYEKFQLITAENYKP